LFSIFQLVSNALRCLIRFVEHYPHLFEDPTVLANICEAVIIPNMAIRASDEELFEDDPDEYFLRDVKASDVDTRRRAACDLFRTLTQNFEAEIIKISWENVQLLLNQFNTAPATNWRAKDTAIYLVISMASKISFIKLHGVTQFYQQQILPELERANINELPVLKADALKFLMTFRNMLGAPIIISSLPQIVRHLSAQSIVVHTYAACAIEKMFVLKVDDGKQAM
jgi:exportin-2 (importin alpha re-exporter)